MNLEGFRLVRKYCFSIVEFESDCQVLIVKLLAQEEDLSPIGHIVQSIRYDFGSYFISKVSFVNYLGNLPVHMLAKLTLGLQNFRA